MTSVARCSNVQRGWPKCRARPSIRLPRQSGAAASYLAALQRPIVEALFRGIGNVNPGKSSPMHGVYKSARSKVWGARHNKR